MPDIHTFSRKLRRSYAAHDNSATAQK